MIELRLITPDNPEWSAYITLYVDYLLAHWPDDFHGETNVDITQNIAKQLEQRYQEGERGFWRVEHEGAVIGLANTWIERASVVTLQIAECYICPAMQRCGAGRALWYALLQWGRLHGAQCVSLETDSKSPANHFWRAMGTDVADVMEGRIRYQCAMPPLKLLWVRHGDIFDISHSEYCLEDQAIGLSESSKHQAEAIGKRLLAQQGWPQVYTSPRRRALETTHQLVRHHPRCAVTTREALAEFFPEELIGTKLSELPARYGEDFSHRMINTPLDTPFTQSEPAPTAAQRVMQAMQAIGSAWPTCEMPLVVSHQNLHNLFVAEVLGASLNSSGQLRLDNLHASMFLYDPATQRFDIQSLNLPLES